MAIRSTLKDPKKPPKHIRPESAEGVPDAIVKAAKKEDDTAVVVSFAKTETGFSAVVHSDTRGYFKLALDKKGDKIGAVKAPEEPADKK